MTNEKWTTDKHGFNVIEVTANGSATVAMTQPHARGRERARLLAASPDLLKAVLAGIAYFEALEEATKDPANMNEYGNAEGDGLDALFDQWASLSIGALNRARP